MRAAVFCAGRGGGSCLREAEVDGERARMALGVGILGLGYVGSTAAACLLEDGHRVVAVDVRPEKVAALAEGRAPVAEPGVEERLCAGLRRGRLTVCSEIGPHIADLDVVWVCVGTPAGPGGALDLSRLLEASRTLARALRAAPARERPLWLVYRSTVMPGTMEERILPLLGEELGEPPGRRYEVVYYPEFLREGSAVADFRCPPKVVLGERAPGIARSLPGVAAAGAPRFELPFRAAELVKLADNAFHALKVAFANETARIAASQGVDPQALLAPLLADTRLNISTAYLHPGAPFGGPCLPKDLQALIVSAERLGLPAPLLAGVRESNARHLDWLVAQIRARIPPPASILQLGLSFKPGTGDLRNSPLLDLAERLLACGYELCIYDPDVDPARLIGADRSRGPAEPGVLFGRLIDDPAPFLAQAELVIRGKRNIALPLPEAVPVVGLDCELVGVGETPR